VEDGLGERYAIMGANFKLINAGYPIHAPVEAALTLVADHKIDVGAIESVAVGMPTNAMKVVDNRDMHNICVQDMLCAALVRGGLKLRESPFPEVLGEPAYARLRARIAVRGHPDLDRDQPDGRGAIVAITTVDGATVSKRVDHPQGHSKRGGLSWPQLAAKWHEGLPECDVDKMLSLARQLDDVEDVSEFLDAFRARP
jgi:2-methylcitrate dehydratase PrpD